MRPRRSRSPRSPNFNHTPHRPTLTFPLARADFAWLRFGYGPNAIPFRMIDRRRFLFATAGLLVLPRFERTFASTAPDLLDDILESIRTRFDLPAMAGAVVFNDQIFSSTVGLRKVGDATGVTRDDQFHLGSCTKSMTATLVGLAIKAGKLKWDTTLAALLPDLAEKMRPEYRSVTIDHLLAHRAGLGPRNSPKGSSLRSLLEDGRLGATPRQQRRKFVELVLQDAPINTPGAQFAYSNQSYVILGAILEGVVDKPWEELMRAQLFEPLEMTTAGFGAMGTPEKLDQPWQHRMQDETRRPIGPGPAADNPPVVGPAGTVHCSVGDWARYVREHLRGPWGASPLARADLFELLHCATFGGNYAAGWYVAERDASGMTLSHTGTNGGNFAMVSINTKRNWALLAMTNQGGDDATRACNQLLSPMLNRVRSTPD